MSESKAIDYLLSEASVPIRWRVEQEILGRKPRTVSEKELLGYPRVKQNLDYLTGKVDFNSLHGSFNHIFENVCGRLHDLGVRRGIKKLDKRIASYLDFLKQLVESSNQGEYLHTSLVGKEFIASIIAGSVSLIGYHDHPVVRTHVTARLKRLSEFRPQFDPNDLYLPDPPGYPKVWRRSFPFLNPEHYTGKRFHLPWIHDVDSWGNLEPKLHQMADEVVSWILTDEYQALPDGYGVILVSPCRYYAMGWSMKLPGWKRDFNPKYMGMLFQYLEALAGFESSRRHPWFQKALDWLEGFVDADGLCQIPKAGLKETGYWVGGGLPAIEPKPRIYRKRVLEATFRLLLIRKIAGID